MSEEDCQAGFATSLGVFRNARAIPTPNERGEPVVDDTFYAMFNASHEALDFTLPAAKWGKKWVELLETDESSDEMDEQKSGGTFKPGATIAVQAWSMALLRQTA
jgi:glycogen operon protein